MMDFNFDGIISDDFDWSIVDKAIHDEVVRLRERITRLETNGGGFNLANSLIAGDADKICPLGCSKDEWGRGDDDGNHMHDADCPFAMAYQMLTAEPETKSEYETSKEVANDLAKMLGIDNAVRLIAQSGKNHDHGPNWYAKWGGMNFDATFGAGTNSASVCVEAAEEGGHLDDVKLYSASEYGRYIETFRAGPWVNRLLNRASILQANNEAEAERLKAERQESQSLKFQEVDF